MRRLLRLLRLPLPLLRFSCAPVLLLRHLLLGLLRHLLFLLRLRPFVLPHLLLGVSTEGPDDNRFAVAILLQDEGLPLHIFSLLILPKMDSLRVFDHNLLAQFVLVDRMDDYLFRELVGTGIDQFGVVLESLAQNAEVGRAVEALPLFISREVELNDFCSEALVQGAEHLLGGLGELVLSSQQAEEHDMEVLLIRQPQVELTISLEPQLGMPPHLPGLIVAQPNYLVVSAELELLPHPIKYITAKLSMPSVHFDKSSTHLQRKE